MIAAILLFSTISFISYWYIKNYINFRNLAKSVKCPLLHPFFGNLFLFSGTVEDITMKTIHMCERNPKRYGVWKGPYFTLYVFNPYDIEMVFKNTKELDKPHFYKILRNISGPTSLTMPFGPKFRQHKKISLPWFQLKNLKNITDHFNNQAEDLVQAFKGKVGQEFDAKYDIGNAVMASLAATVVGVNKEYLAKDTLTFSDLIEKLAHIATERMNKIWLMPDLLYYMSGKEKQCEKYKDVFDEIVTRVIRERKNSYKQGQIDNVFVDQLFEAKLDDGSPFSDIDIKNELKTMLIAGHTTTLSSLGFCLSLLGLDKDVQEKLYQEVTFVLGDDMTRPITYEDIKRFEYMDRVLQETWRLYPPASVIPKVATQDFQLGDIRVPKNTEVLILTYALHRSPDIFENPAKFNPDNFLPEKTTERHPCSFVPFSGGNRNCFGKHYSSLLQKVFIARIIQNFKIHSNVPQKDYRLSFEVTLTRKEGFLIVLEPRNNV